MGKKKKKKKKKQGGDGFNISQTQLVTLHIDTTLKLWSNQL